MPELFKSIPAGRVMPLAALVVYLIAAFTKIGYFHPDEHYQLLEFGNFLTGRIPATDLAWEYHDKIRPSFQPWIAAGVFTVLRRLGVGSPYSAALVLRMTTAIMAVFVIRRFSEKYTGRISPVFRSAFLFLSYFLWFLPMINVRFSSESWSGLFFLLALSFINEEKGQKGSVLFGVGMLCGFAFLCRYQTAAMFLGLILWMGYVQKAGIGGTGRLAAGFVLVVLLGIALDYFFYRSWTFSCWNYFNVNIIGDVASQFGTISWSDYLLVLLVESFVPVGIVVFAAFIIVCIDSPRSVIVWVIIPFLLMHLVIPHKELRFMFPLVNLLPFILVMGYQQALSFFPAAARSRGFLRLGVALLLLVDLLVLTPAIFTAPSGGRILITKFLYDESGDRPFKLYTRDESNPFRPYTFLRQSLYEVPGAKVCQVAGYDQLSKKDFDGDTTCYLVLFKGEAISPALASRIREWHLTLVKRGRPGWVSAMEDAYSPGIGYYEYVLYSNKPI